MTRLLTRWVLLVLAIVLASYVTSLFGLGFTAEYDSLSEVLKLFLGAAVLAIVNATIGPLIKLLTLPISCLTLGLFSLVINALMLYWVGSMGLGFQVLDFWAALIGSIVLSIINGALNGLVPDEDDRKKKN